MLPVSHEAIGSGFLVLRLNPTDFFLSLYSSNYSTGRFSLEKFNNAFRVTNSAQVNARQMPTGQEGIRTAGDGRFARTETGWKNLPDELIPFVLRHLPLATLASLSRVRKLEGSRVRLFMMENFNTLAGKLFTFYEEKDKSEAGKDSAFSAPQLAAGTSVVAKPFSIIEAQYPLNFCCLLELWKSLSRSTQEKGREALRDLPFYRMPAAEVNQLQADLETSSPDLENTLARRKLSGLVAQKFGELRGIVKRMTLTECGNLPDLIQQIFEYQIIAAKHGMLLREYADTPLTLQSFIEDPHLYAEREFVIRFLERGDLSLVNKIALGLFFSDLSADLQVDKSVRAKFRERRGIRCPFFHALEAAPWLYQNKEFILRAVRHSEADMDKYGVERFYSNLSPVLQKNREVLIYLACHSEDFYLKLPDTLTLDDGFVWTPKKDRELAFKIVTVSDIDSKIEELIDPSLANDPAFIKDCIRVRGDRFDLIPEALKSNREIIEAAARSVAESYGYSDVDFDELHPFKDSGVPDEVTQDVVFMREMLKIHPWYMYSCPEDSYSDRESVEIIAGAEPSEIARAAFDLQSDADFIRKLAATSIEVLYYLDKRVWRNPSFVQRLLADVEVISNDKVQTSIEGLFLNGASIKQEALKRLILNPSASLEDLKGAQGNPQMLDHQFGLASKDPALARRMQRDHTSIRGLALTMGRGVLPDYQDFLWLTQDKDRLLALLGPQLRIKAKRTASQALVDASPSTFLKLS